MKTQFIELVVTEPTLIAPLPYLRVGDAVTITTKSGDKVSFKFSAIHIVETPDDDDVKPDIIISP